MRTWTLAEANAALPRVRSIVDDGRRAIAGLRDVDAQLEDLRIVWGDDAAKPSCPDHAEYVRYLEAKDHLADEMANVLLRIEAVGCEVKDLEQGLVDFRGEVGSQPVYLCWRHGEPNVGHWHTLEGGFANRRRIPGV